MLSKPKIYDVITIGGASRDVFFCTSEGMIVNDLKNHQKLIAFEYGSKIIPEKADFSYGGGALNTAISFAKLGMNVSTVMNLGCEGTGEMVIRDLKKYKIDTENIIRDPKHHTALSLIVSISGEDHTMFLYRGSNNYLNIIDWRPLRSKWFYVSSLSGESAHIIPELFSFARAHHVKVAWNPGAEQLKIGFEDIKDYLAETDVLILNKSEAEYLLLTKNGSRPKNDEELLAELHEAVRGIVVITEGELGSYVYDGKKKYFEPVKKVKALETTGAGDAYGSTFVGLHILGYGTKYCMKLAAANSANVVKYMGAQKGLMTFSELSATIEDGGLLEAKK